MNIQRTPHGWQHDCVHDVAVRIDMPTYFLTHVARAAACGQLGRHDEAREALRNLLAQKPNFLEEAPTETAKWFGTGDLLDRLMEGLRKAEGGIGVKVGGHKRTAGPALELCGNTTLRARLPTFEMLYSVRTFRP